MGALSVTTGRRLFSPAPCHRWLRWAKLGRRSQKCSSVEYAKLLRIWPGKLFSVVAPGQSPRHTRRHEQRTWLHPDGNPVTLTLMMILSVGGLYGWQRWQQQQRLWQTAVRCGIFCSFCAMTPTPTTGTACFASADEVGWCLSAEGRGLTAPRGHPSRCARAGRGSRWLALRLVWGFMVCAAPPGRVICGCRARPAAGAL